MNTLKKLTRNNIWSAIEDYFRHTESNEVYDNISDNFVERLALPNGMPITTNLL